MLDDFLIEDLVVHSVTVGPDDAEKLDNPESLEELLESFNWIWW